MEFFSSCIQLFESGFSEFKWKLEIPLFSFLFCNFNRGKES